MFFKRKSNIIFRNYESFGYLTDNRNFGYQKANNSESNDIGDKIVSESGAVFLSVLDEKPKTLDELANQIGALFTDVGIETIKNDATEFYSLLEFEGFVSSGETVEECNKNDLKIPHRIAGQQKEENNPSAGKTEKSTQEFFDEFFGGKPQLTNLHMEITGKCNERCVHCYIPHDSKASHMDSNLFYSILEQCREMNVLHLTISGGEPMLHNDFCDFLKACVEYNFSVNILSNLVLLNDEILEEMTKNHLLSVQTSLYSMDASIHDEITQIKGSFEKTLSAIFCLQKNGIPLQISCPIMKQNLNSYRNVMEWGVQHNIHVGSDYVILGRCDNTTSNLINRLSLDDIGKDIKQRVIHEAQYIEQLEKEASKKNVANPDDPICSVCHSSICISENGNVYPCAGWQGYVVGNLKEAPLKTIWDFGEKVNYLRNLRNRDFPKCICCPANAFCTMCMVRNANEHPLGDPLVVNEYFCAIAEIYKKLVSGESF